MLQTLHSFREGRHAAARKPHAHGSAHRIVFDVGNGVVLKDGRRIARFADFVELRLNSGREVLLGHTKEQIDASSLAARVAGAIDRPVKVADYSE